MIPINPSGAAFDAFPMDKEMKAKSMEEMGGIEPGELARVLFMTFIYLADCERDITPQEVRSLRKMTANPDWARHPGMRAALEQLAASYPEFWSRYEAKTLVVDRTGLQAQIDAVHGALSGNGVALLLDDLQDFVGRFEPGTLSSMLRGGGVNTPGRTKARAELAELISTSGTGVGRARGEVPAQAATASSAQAPLPTSEHDVSRIEFGLPSWIRGRTRLRCVSVLDETPDVKSFSFVAQPACLFHYQPGQFITLELQINGTTVRRSYTISSSPTRPYLLTVTVKRGIDGFASTWLHENMRQGVECMVSGPHGDFHCRVRQGQKLLLISAGSGVTPMMSMLRYFADTAPDTDIVFINSVRTPGDIIFEKELLFLSGLFGTSLKLIILPSRIERGQAWHGLVGRLDADLLPILAADFAERDAFVCGPQGFMDDMRRILGERGHPPENFFQESFGGPKPPRVPASPPPRQAPTEMATKAARSAPSPAEPPMQMLPAQVPPASSVVSTFTGTSTTPSHVRFAVSGIHAEGIEGDTLLDIAEANGVLIGSSCRSGTCGTCKVRVTSGAVSMQPQSVLSDEELAEGYVLSCIAQPTGQAEVQA